MREWAASGDPRLHYLAFHTAFSHADEVSGLGEKERLDICVTFLDAALSGRYGDDVPDGRYSLAHTTLSWLRQLAGTDGGDGRSALDTVLAMIERVARNGDASTRDVILLGILEHAFEDEATRALFAAWADDADLRPMHEEAVRLAGAP